MTDFTISPVQGDPSRIEIHPRAAATTEAAAALIIANQLRLGTFQPMLMRCGCFFDSPVRGTPHDACPLCFGHGSYLYVPVLRYPAYRAPRVRKVLEQAGFSVGVLSEVAQPIELQEEDEERGQLRLAVDQNEFTHYCDFVASNGIDGADAIEACLADWPSPLAYERRGTALRVETSRAEEVSAALMFKGCWISQRAWRTTRSLTDEPPF